MAWLVYFGVQVRNMNNPPANLLQAVEKGEVCVGPSFRLSGLGGMAMLDTELLANAVKAELTPGIHKRHGSQTTVSVVRCETTCPVANKIKEHSAKVREKLNK